MKDKVVIITGGSSGIGKAIAERFGKEGARLVITGRREEPLMQMKDTLAAQGVQVAALVADVSKKEDNRKLAEFTVQQYGRIDVLINNAGISMRALFEELDLEVIDRVMSINFFGAVYATKYCLPEIIKSKGTIIGVSSIAGYRGLPGRTGYSASKFALQGFLEALRAELLKKDVNVMIAAPGFTASDIRNRSLTKDGGSQGQTPREEGKMMSAEECADHIYKATVRRKKILILTRQGKLTVWLNKRFPVFMDKMVYKALAKEPDSPFK